MLLVFVVFFFFFFLFVTKLRKGKKLKKKINLFRSKSHWYLAVVSVAFIFVHVSRGIEKYESLWIGFYGSWHVQIGKNRGELTTRQICVRNQDSILWLAFLELHRGRAGQRLQAAFVVTPSALPVYPGGLHSPSHSC